VESGSIPRWPRALRRYNAAMIRIREILDPELRDRIRSALAEQRGCTTAAIPDWFELDDADFVDLLNLSEKDADLEPRDDYRQ
jgi:hypothetical protein